MGNTFGGGSAAGLSSGGFGAGSGDPSAGGGASDPGSPGSTGGGFPSGPPQSVGDYLRSQNMSFYLGGGVGLSMFNGTFMTSRGTPPAPMISQKAKVKNKMPEVALMFGLQQKGIMITDFGLTAMFGPTTIRNKGGAYENNIKEKYRFVLHGAAGVPLTPSINVFGKLGLVYSSFNIGYKSLGSTINNTAAVRGLGVAPGVMLQYKSSETVSYNLDLSYLIYQSITTPNLAPTSAGKFVYKTKISPRIITILLGGTLKLGGA